MFNSYTFVFLKTFVLILAIVGLSACKPSVRNSADAVQEQRTAVQMRQAVQEVPNPAVVNWTERRMVKLLYELRDDPNFSTYSYIVAMDGTKVFICNSVGYGINASIQFTNPMRVYREGNLDRSATFIPQPEPNGLFMPEGLSATYVMCLDEKSEEVKPVYVEPQVMVSPFKIH